MFEGIPDRRKGLVIGIVGGLIGAYAMRRYQRDVLPKLFPDVDLKATASEVSVPMAYTLLTETIPSAEEQHRLEAGARWGTGVLMGLVYGATRTSTLPRDFAGGFFYGIRLWIGDEIIYRLTEGAEASDRRPHVALLTGYWVYSFVTANSTRLLYRLFSPQDW